MEKYKLEDKIGNGGYSSVYKVQDRIGIRYACKILDKTKVKRNKVRTEIEMLKSLRFSTKVVGYIDALEDDKHYYIIQELCKGGDIQKYISNYNIYAENTVASIIRGVLRGLYHIHKTNIIHGDIKASNILLADKSEEAEVKIIDFGSSQYSSAEDIIEVENLQGTPWFLSPEALSSKLCCQSDIWSVGVLTFQLLSGKMPFNDKDSPLNPSITKIYRGILLEDPKLTGSCWNNISEEAKDFIRICLNKDYKKRPLSIDLINHKWLEKSNCEDRFQGQELNCSPFKYDISSMMNEKTIETFILQK